MERSEINKPGTFGRLAALALGVAALAAADAGLADGVYRWADERGEVHYGDRPPSREESTPVEIKAAPAPTPGDARRRAKTRRLLEAFESRRARQKDEAAQARAAKARRNHNCETARQRVAILLRARVISRRGPEGQRIYLSDEERAENLARARTLESEWCR